MPSQIADFVGYCAQWTETVDTSVQHINTLANLIFRIQSARDDQTQWSPVLLTEYDGLLDLYTSKLYSDMDRSKRELHQLINKLVSYSS